MAASGLPKFQWLLAGVIAATMIVLKATQALFEEIRLYFRTHGGDASNRGFQEEDEEQAVAIATKRSVEEQQVIYQFTALR